jgi:hypothetical protein
MGDDNSCSIVQAIGIYHYAACIRNNDDSSWNGGPRAENSVARQTSLHEFGFANTTVIISRTNNCYYCHDDAIQRSRSHPSWRIGPQR